MTEPSLSLLLPDGTVVDVGPEAIIGRARLAAVRLDDARLSTVHAEISWRDGRFRILSRGGRVTVDGAVVRDAALAVGSRITLAPGVVLEVADVSAGDEPGIPPTAGRDAVVLLPTQGGVAVWVGADPEPRVIDGVPGQLALVLLRATAPVPWEVAAAALWPDEGAIRDARGPLRSDAWTALDERRFRNRFDQVLASLRATLDGLRPGRWVSLKNGALTVELGLTDRFEESPCGPAASPR